MKYILPLFLILSLCSCASWSTREKFAAGTMIAASLADGYTTKRVLDEGGYERNPFLGKYPSQTRRVIFFSITDTFKLLLAHFIPEYREAILYGFAGINGYYALNNYKLVKELERRNNYDTRYRYEISNEGR